MKFVAFPEEAKRRFLRRSRRQHATALRQRNGEIEMGTKPLALTPDELQQVYQDWTQLVEEFE